MTFTGTQMIKLLKASGKWANRPIAYLEKRKTESRKRNDRMLMCTQVT